MERLVVAAESQKVRAGVVGSVGLDAISESQHAADVLTRTRPPAPTPLPPSNGSAAARLAVTSPANLRFLLDWF